MALYTFAILGSPTDQQRTLLKEAIGELMTDLKPETGGIVKFLDSSTMNYDFYSSNFVSAYFGHEQQEDIELLLKMVKEELNVIPVAQSGPVFRTHIPECLHDILGYVVEDNENLRELALAMLESVGLLSQKRKVFISYVQNETSLVAQQLYNILIKLRYDVFLDSYKLHHGQKLPDILSNHIIDSDIVIALDSPGYKFSEMAQYEYSLAKSRQISVLNLIFPGTPKDINMEFNNSVQLSEFDFEKQKESATDQFSFIIEKKVREIVEFTQKLRCSSVIAQHNHLIGLIARYMDSSVEVSTAIGAHCSIAVQIEDSVQYIYPCLGCPTSNTMHDIFLSVKHGKKPILAYNNDRFPDVLTKHINWLNSEIRSIYVSSARDLEKIQVKDLERDQ